MCSITPSSSPAMICVQDSRSTGHPAPNTHVMLCTKHSAQPADICTYLLKRVLGALLHTQAGALLHTKAAALPGMHHSCGVSRLFWC